jgi:hypothetical protein
MRSSRIRKGTGELDGSGNVPMGGEGGGLVSRAVRHQQR